MSEWLAVQGANLMGLGGPDSCLGILLVWLVLTAPVASGREGPGSVGGTWQPATTSWGSGVVVPDGARLEGGAGLSWKSATNITAVARLPDIVNPDGATYLVLSAMASDRSVFQVAAGISPANSGWASYSWVVSEVDSSSPLYIWILNGSGPKMSPGDTVAISISVDEASGWRLCISDVSTGSTLERGFPQKSALTFAAGDQEVFAFESYSRSESAFHEMGNATLVSIAVDGRKVVGGTYPHSGWDAVHNPLFMVGSSSPPAFISMNLEGGSAVWSYTHLWSGSGWTFPPASVLATVTVLAGLVVLTILTGLLYRGRLRNRRPPGRLRCGENGF